MKRPVGKPNRGLQVKIMTFVTEEFKERLNKACPPQKKAQFIRDAIKEKLDRLELGEQA